MHGERTSAWRWAVLEIAIAIGLALFVAWGADQLFQPVIGDRGVSLGPLLIRPGVLAAIAAVLVGVVGLIWMIRILLRAAGDEPPPWRYRDR